jgi:pimeloyl-ACP methyl ester carboxylesterase
MRRVSRKRTKAATISAMNSTDARPDTSHTWPERGASILNGMFGDYLQRRGNDLAITMSFHHHGRPLALHEASLRAAHPSLSPKLCILVHGYCCNESVWTFPVSADQGEGSYGTRLQRDGAYTPFYIRYNTGLPIAESGRHLAKLLQALVAAYPLPIEEIVLIGHSMGGLVIREACDPAQAETKTCLTHVKRIIYIGTPHEGADLERFAHVTTGALQAIPSHVTRLVGDILNLRSRGVKDLRRGKPLSGSGSLPWLASARHYLLVGTLTKDPEHPVGRLFGDALVRVPRADMETAGEMSNDMAGEVSSPQITVFPGVHHLRLAHDATVYRRIRKICTGE